MVPIKSSISFCLNISQKLQTHSFTSFIVLTYHRIKAPLLQPFSLFACLWTEVISSFMFKKKKVHSWVGWFVFLLSPGAFGEKLNKGTMCFDTPCTFQDLVEQWALINLSCSLGLLSLLEKQRNRSKGTEAKACHATFPPEPWEASPGASFPLTNAGPCAACLSA